MTDYIKLRESNCKNCYKCIRHCPVKSIKFYNNEAHIVGDECILCGQCYVVCPQNAKKIRSDRQKVKDAFAAGKRVVASIAPSFVVNFDNMNLATMTAALKKLGFSDVQETAIGATIVKKEYDKMLNEHKQDVVISSCCHTVNTLIQKYFPDVLPSLAHIMSPMQAHCAKIKSEDKDAFTVFIGPCISKKEEADHYPEHVDCVLTFRVLANWLKEENIEFEHVEDTCPAGKARFFPSVGGIIRSMDCTAKDYEYITVDGVDNCIRALKDIQNGHIHNCFIEMSACSGGCIEGPAAVRRRAPISDHMTVSRYAGEKDFDVPEVSCEQLKKEMPFIGLHRQMPGSRAIEEILHRMGKYCEDDELNCGSCGYDTCREKAIAVYLGKADLTMCLPYLKEKAESFSDTIIKNTPNGILVLNENLEIQQINRAALDMMNIKHESDVMGGPVVRILNPQDFIQVMSTEQDIHDKKIYLAEYKKYVEETVIYDKSYKIIMCLMRDITDEETSRVKKENVSRQTIEITDKVIEKQMRVVQEIASLLGETTAETKIALTNLKESLKDE